MIGRVKAPESVQSEEPRSFDDFDLRLGDVMRGERATMGKSLLDVQRELKIKASYIAAIENSDPSAFETPGFIAGYVRSYARYLGLDPEWAFRVFCTESGFETAHGLSGAASSRRSSEPRVSEGLRGDLFANSSINFAPKGEAFLSRIEPGAIGSTAVLLALIGLIGYGGFAVLKEVQRVDVVPVDQTPALAATLDPLADVAPPPETDLASGVAPKDPEALDRIYRPQALEVPVMVARDGPIAALDPSSVGALAPRELTEVAAAPPLSTVAGGAIDTAVAEALATPQSADAPAALAVAEGAPPFASPRVLGNGRPDVTIVAVRESWVRVRSADGTNIFEKVMQPGETFTLPQTEGPANLRTGNAGGVYFSVAGQMFGPAGGGGSVVNVASLAPADVTSAFQTADLARDRALCDVMIAATEQPDPTLLACRD